MAARDPYSAFRESEYAHGRDVARERHGQRTELASMIESMRGQNSERVAQIAADVGMANVEAHKPLLGAQANAINEMTPLRKRAAEGEIAGQDITNESARFDLSKKPMMFDKALEGLEIDDATRKAILLSHAKGMGEGEDAWRGGKMPSFLRKIYGEDYAKQFDKSPEVAATDTGVAKPSSDWRTSGFGRAGRVALPMIGAAAGGLIAGGTTMGAGAIPGAMGGGAIGENIAQILYGEDLNVPQIAIAGLSGGIAGKYGTKYAKKAPNYSPDKLDKWAQKSVDWFGR
jgi:hypothetical protein